MRFKFTFSNAAILCAFLFTAGSAWSQIVYNFTSCGVTGSIGPTQAQANAAYSSTNLAGNVTVTGGIQYWTVPASGAYRIEAFGGQGYGSFGGRGAHISGEFTLVAGQQLKILVGQKAGDYYLYPGTGYNAQFGGGGGTFVTTSTNNPIVVAGGGGGNHGTSWNTSCDGQITNNGSAGVAGSTTGTGGTAGGGGGEASSAHGGGGLLGNGLGAAGGGKSFVNGGEGGFLYGFGGFGGGGGTTSWNNFRAGGGGGYSGGGAGNNGSTCCSTGGGGGSFNSGTMPANIAGVQIGDGMVIITPLTSVPNDAGISSILGFSPACTGTYPVQAVANNFGNNAISGLVVGWSINGVVQTPFTLTTSLDTVNGVGPNSQIVTLGNVLIDGSTLVKAWTYLPNNVNDTVNGNDTTSMNIIPMQVVPNFLSGINCNGGTNGVVQAGVINNAGGTMTYSWSTGINGNLLVGIGAGTYVLTGSNGTCTDTASFVMTHPPAIAYSDATSGVSCFGDSTGTSTLTISGGTPGYTVSWAAGGTGLTNNALPGGMNAFTITDNNSCQVTGSVNVTQPTALNLTSAVTPETLGSDGAVDLTVTGGTPGYTYLWSNAATTQDLSGLNSGTFNVTVTDANGCTSTLSAVVNSVVGINEKSDDFGISIYPNPSNGHFTVALANGDKNTSIEVFDVLGKKVFGKVNPSSNTKIELNVHNGVYLVKVTNGSNSYLERIVVKN